MFASVLGLWACTSVAAPPGLDTTLAAVPAPGPGQEVAVLAGGCFWCLESDMDKLLGVVSTTSGFAGGTTEHPTYAQVGAHGTGHLEAVHVIYDPQVVTYAQVLDWFWHHIDPTDGGGQFCDRGESYLTAIFPQDASQLAIATQSRDALAASGVLPGEVKTTLREGHRFWPAENYHQDFSRKDPQRYRSYRQGCGRDDKVAKIWAKARQTAPAGH